MKLNKFKKGLLIYTGVLVLLGGLFVGYVVLSLKDYEANQIDTYVKKALTKGALSDEIELSNYETQKDVTKALQNLVDHTEIKIKETQKNHYIITSDGVEIAQLEVEEGKAMTKLGILNYSKLSTKSLTFSNGGALYAYNVQIPSTYTLEVNGITVDPSESTGREVLDGYTDAQSQNAPTNSVYALNGFINKPTIVIKDESQAIVEPTIDKNKITVSTFYKTDDEVEAMSKLVESIDVMKLAKNYSLFMTNDLTGAKHGFGTLEPYFIEGTEVYKQAYQWASGVDISFVSDHTFKNPMFSNERLSQFEIYNKTSFSVLVHLDKNMIITGKERIDTMNSKWYFVYDNGWKLVDMKHIGKGN